MKVNSVNNYSNYNYQTAAKNRSALLNNQTDTVSFSGKKTKAAKINLIALLTSAALLFSACGAKTAGSKDNTYTVQQGDSLSSIVRQHIGEDASWDEVSYYVDELALDNNIEDPSSLKTTDENGDPVVLDISCLVEDDEEESFDGLKADKEKIEYTVKDGESLSSIVRQYLGEDASWSEVSPYVEQIAEDNGISDPSNLKTKDENGNPVVLDISCLSGVSKKTEAKTEEKVEEKAPAASSNDVSFDLPSKETPVVDSDGNIVASVKKVSSKVKNGELSGKTIMINAGHGGFNPENNVFDVGASNGEVTEYQLTNEYTNALAQKLVDKGADIVMCQGSVRGLSKSPVGNAIQEFASERDNPDKSAFVSIHFDSYENPDYNGASIRYQEGQNSNFANLLTKSFKKNNINLFKEDPVADRLLVTKTASANGIDRSVLIECAVLSNPDDSKKVQTESFKDNITDAIANGIVESFS